MRPRIFVQIPAYRDPELLPTLQNLIETAEDPQGLRIAVVWQHGDAEAALEPELRRLPQVELLPVPARYSAGCNWARAQAQSLWDGEAYTLFLDSHHRFAPGWDACLIDWHQELRRAGIARPIISGYLPDYAPQDDPDGRLDAVLDLEVHERAQGLIYRLIGHPVDASHDLNQPFTGRFTSLHLLFAAGSFNEDIPFDPAIYFFADEVAIALRAYTHGYDLFQPHRVIGWHLWDRSTRGAHWHDHADWTARHAISLSRLRALYGGTFFGRHGAGTRRSVADYAAHIGTPLIQ